MSIKQQLGELAIHAAAAFTETLANHTQPNSGSVVARQIGSQFADALVVELMSSLPQDKPNSPRTGELFPAKNHSDQEIADNRMAVWNHPIPVTPEMLRAIEQYQHTIRESSQ